MAAEADEGALRAAVSDAARGYFAARRARVRPFVDRHFSLRGALALHRRAAGWDMARAPANLALAPAHLVARLTGAAARRLGARRTADWLGSRDWFFETAVAREVRRLIAVELLEIPAEGGTGRDALAEAIAAAPGVLAAYGPMPPERRAALSRALAEYAGVRAPAAEITTALAAAGAGAAVFGHLTPGALTLGPAVAASLAHGAAVASFPLGAAAGGLWYAAFPAKASATMIAASTAGVLGAAATVSAFAGVVADPVQRALGVHERRLMRLIDTMERQFTQGEGAGLVAREHYVARLLDIGDLALAGLRVLRP